jgi:DegV family protein with EDD domain
MTVKVVTDSTSDLTPEIAAALGITVVPLNVHFGAETYRDGVDLTTEDFYQKLPVAQILPTTSAPAPGLFAETYDRLASETDEIVSIHISSKLSATYQAALDGKELSRAMARIEVVDSQWAIAGLGLIAVAAAATARDGGSLDEVAAVVRNSMQRVDFRMAFDTLEYLRRGGRIGRAQAFLGSALKINPILTIRDGLTEGVARVRCRAKAIDYLCDFASGFNDIEALAIEDGTAADEVAILAERLGSKFPAENIYRMKVSPVIGTHVGPHVLGVGVLPRQ